MGDRVGMDINNTFGIILSSKVGYTFDYVWKYESGALTIKKVKALTKAEKAQTINSMRSRDLTGIEFIKFIDALRNENGYNITLEKYLGAKRGAISLDILNKLGKEKGIEKGYGVAEFTREELNKLTKNNKLTDGVPKYSKIKLAKSELDYITGISMGRREDMYLTVVVNLTMISKKDAVEWYNTNKEEIFEKVKKKYNKTTRLIDIPIGCYKIGAVTITNTSTLVYRLELKDKIIEAVSGGEEE